MRRVLSTIDSISQLSGKTLSVLVLIVMTILIVEIMLRYVFNSPTIWAHETSLHIYAAYAILAGAYVLFHHQHVKVDVIYGRFSPRARAILDSVTYLMFFLFVGLMLVYGWDIAWHAVKIRETSLPPFRIPTYPLRLTIPIAAILILLQGVAHWIRALSMAIRGKELA